MSDCRLVNFRVVPVLHAVGIGIKGEERQVERNTCTRQNVGTPVTLFGGEVRTLLFRQ